MRRLLLALLILPCMAHATRECELEAVATWPAALVRLLNRALDHQVADLADVQEIADGKKWFNPVVLIERTPESLALRDGITKALKHVKVEEQPFVRAELQKELKARILRQQRVEQVREETKLVLAPQVLSIYGHGQSGYGGTFKFAHNWFEGRPVFVAAFKKRVPQGADKEWDLILFDPFHKDPLERKRIIKEFKTLAKASDQPNFLDFVEREGRLIVSMIKPDFSYDMQAKTEITPALDYSYVGRHLRVGNLDYLIKTSGDYTTSVFKREGGKEYQLHFTYPGKGSREDFSIVDIDGKHYLTFLEFAGSGAWDVVRINMATNARVAAPIQIRPGAVAYAANAAPRVFMVNITNAYGWDFRTMKEFAIEGAEGAWAAGTFNFQGRDYLLSGSILYDVETSAPVGGKLTSTPDKLATFTYEGLTYAFLIHPWGHPEVIRITRESPR